jgi:hypothetical protein
MKSAVWMKRATPLSAIQVAAAWMLDQENLTELEQAWLHCSRAEGLGSDASSCGTLDKNLCKTIVQQFAYAPCNETSFSANHKSGLRKVDIPGNSKQSASQACVYSGSAIADAFCGISRRHMCDSLSWHSTGIAVVIARMHAKCTYGS